MGIAEIIKYRPDIDGLRAVAVLPVVLYHAGLPGPSGGFIGVDVFFVISGFLITSIVAGEIAKGEFSLVSFYERRARRILPALIVMISSCFVIGWLVLLPGEMKDFGQSAFFTAFFASNVYFAMTLDYFAQAADFAPLLHTWSLAVEEQFYLFFPPLLMFLAWRGWQGTLWIVAGLSLVSFSAAMVMLPIKPDWVFYLIIFRAWELGAGAILVFAAVRPPQSRIARELLALVGISAILIPVFIFDAAMPFPAAAALPPVIGATILIWIGAQGGGSLISALLGHRVLVWIGLISYSLYLWHWPILAFLRIVLDTADLPMTIAIAAVVGAVATAWLSFRFVERPFRVHPSRGFGQRSIFAASALSLAIVIGNGWIMHVSNGLPARLPAAATTMAAFAEDRNPRRENCFNRVPTEGLCSIGLPSDEDGEVDFLLWGDSHALAIMPGIELAAERAGQRGVFAGKTGCPPILHVQRFSKGQTCHPDFSDRVLSWLESRKDVSLVVLSARWALYVEGTRPQAEPGGDLRLEWTGDRMRNLKGIDNAGLVEISLHETIAAILASGRRVVLLGPVPEVGRNVPSSLARAALLGQLPGPFLTTSQHEARVARTDDILARLADTDERITYISLSAQFCGVQFCRVTTAEGLPLYVDSNHLSRTAAEILLFPRLLNIWEEIK